MSAMPLTSIAELEGDVTRARRATTAHDRRCQQPGPSCDRCWQTSRRFEVAVARLAAARSQQPDHSIGIGGALERRLARDSTAAA